MDNLDKLRQPKQPYWALNINGCGQNNMPSVSADRDEHVFTADSEPDDCESNNGDGIHSFSRQKCGDDLERGVESIGPDGGSFSSSAKKMFEKSGSSFLQGSFNQRINGPLGKYTGKIKQCEFPGEEVRLGFPFNQAMAKESAFSGHGNQSEIVAVKGDMGIAESVNTVPGCSDKIRHDDALKPGWQKPPRPPRQTTDSSRERVIKGISDAALLRKAKLERMRSLRKHKFAKSSSAKTSLWALLVTLSFCVIIILQGIFSQGSSSLQYSLPASGQTSALPVQNFVSHATNGEPNQAEEMDHLSSSRHRREKI